MAACMLSVLCVSAGAGGRNVTVATSVVGTDAVKLDKVTNDDVAAAVAVTRPSARLLGAKYEAWQAEFGSC